MGERDGFVWPEWLIGVWNAVMYKQPADPDEGITRPLRPRLILRLFRGLGDTDGS